MSPADNNLIITFTHTLSSDLIEATFSKGLRRVCGLDSINSLAKGLGKKEYGKRTWKCVAEPRECIVHLCGNSVEWSVAENSGVDNHLYSLNLTELEQGLRQ